MESRFDVVIAGGGLAGLTLARQLHLEAPTCACWCARSGTHPVPEAAFKVGESSVEIGAHYFRKVIGLEPLLRRDHLPKLGLRYFFPYGQQPRYRHARRARRRRLPARAVVPARSRPAREFAAADGPSSRAPRCSTAARVRRIELGDPRAHGDVRRTPAARARSPRAGWSTASGRAGLLKRQAGAGPRRARTPPTPAGSALRSALQGRRLVGRSGLAGARADRPALAEHQPPDGAGLLGVADSARLRQHQLRHRRRRRRCTRSIGSIASIARWTGCASSSRSAPTSSSAHADAARGLSRPAALRARLRARLLARPLGADGRIWRLHRPVLFARLGLHRHRQRLRHRSDHPRPARRGRAARAEAFNATHLRLFDAFI